MTVFGSADVGFLLIGGMNVLGDTTNIDDEQDAPVEETTTLGVSEATYKAIGLKGYKLSQQGFYNDAANRSNAALVAPGASQVLSFSPYGDAIGNLVVCNSMVEVSYKRQISSKALTKALADYVSAQGHDEAVNLHALGAETATGNNEGTYYDGGASSALGGTAYLQVTDLTLGGYDSFTVTLVHSANHSAWSDLLAMTTATLAPGAERKAVAGSVSRYLAVRWAFVGSGSDPSATFHIAFKRN